MEDRAKTRNNESKHLESLVPGCRVQPGVSSVMVHVGGGGANRGTGSHQNSSLFLPLTSLRLSVSLQSVISYCHPALKLSTRRELQSHSVIHPSSLSAADRLCRSASVQSVWFPQSVSLIDNWPNRPERQTVIGSLSRWLSPALRAADSRRALIFLFLLSIPRRLQL